jgi:hypothetical protein
VLLDTSIANPADIFQYLRWLLKFAARRRLPEARQG